MWLTSTDFEVADYFLAYAVRSKYDDDYVNNVEAEIGNDAD